jgi:hypothetical protein
MGIYDHIVTWTKPQRPEWMYVEMYDIISDILKVRELRIKVAQPGFRVNELVLVTSFLDSELYSTSLRRCSLNDGI